MNLEIIMLSEVSQKEKNKYHMVSLICGISSMTQINISTRQKQTLRCREQTCGCQGGGEMWEEWIGSLGLVDSNSYIQDGKQSGPTVQHRGLYSISCDKT